MRGRGRRIVGGGSGERGNGNVKGSETEKGGQARGTHNGVAGGIARGTREGGGGALHGIPRIAREVPIRDSESYKRRYAWCSSIYDSARRVCCAVMGRTFGFMFTAGYF